MVRPFLFVPYGWDTRGCLEGIVHDIRYILGISLFIRKTSIMANQYLINFRLEFFANIRSRHGINLLNKYIQA